MIESFAYTLDANGNRTAMMSSAGTETYTLNALNQLVGVDYPDRPDVSFTYDAAGNRVSETVDGAGTTTYGYDDASRLTAAGATSFSHEGDGNVTSAGDDTFTYDWDGRMSSATVDGTTTSFAHDADGLRVDVDGTGLLYDRAADGPVPALLSDVTTTGLGAGGGPVSAVTSSGTGAVHADALGSIRATTGPSGAETGTAGYDVFGTRIGEVGRLGFTGAQQDPSGNVWLHARTYLPDTGRFASVDPVRPGGPGVAGDNPYSYVVNNPTTHVDPTGRSVDYAILTSDDAAVIAAAEAIVAAEARRILLRRAFIRIATALGVGLAAAGGCAVACPRPQPQPRPETDTDTRRPRPDSPPIPDPLPQPDPQPDPQPPHTDDDDRRECKPAEVAAWWASLPPGRGLPQGEAGAYQGQVAGPVTKIASGHPAQVDADGIRITTCSFLEAKHVGSSSSPYLPGHELPFVTAQTVDEFRRYGIVARSPETPVTNTVVVTNEQRAVPVMHWWLAEAAASPSSVEVQGCDACSR